MSSEPPPNPITNVFNVTDWIHVASGGGNSDFATNATNSVNTQNVNITATDAAGTYYPTFVGSTSGNNPELIDNNMTYNPSTNTLTVGTLVGAVSGNITNAVTSNKVVIASNVADNTNYYPTFVTGSTSSSLPVLTGTMRYNPFSDTFTATNITATGTLSGSFSGTIATATTANNLKISQTASTSDFYPIFASTYATTSTPVYGDSDFFYSPSTNTLTVPALTATTINGTVTDATNATKTYITAVTTGTTFYPTFVDGTSGNKGHSVDIDLQFNSATNTLSVPNITSNTLTLNGTGTALSIPTATTISAPNANMEASQFTGALSGTATTANGVKIDTTTNNTDFYPTFSSSTSSASSALKADLDLKYNPVTNTMTVPNLTVGNTLTATVANATNATAVSVSIDTTTTTDLTPTFVGDIGNQSLKVGSLRYKPSTDTLTATTFNGNSTSTSAVSITDYTSSTGSFYVPLTTASTGIGNIGVDTAVQYNGTTNTMSVPNLTVSNTLTATVGSATTASNIVVANNSTTNTNYLPTFVTAAGSSQVVSTDSDFTYNPSTNTLTVGTLNGTVTTATNATNLNTALSSDNNPYYIPFVSNIGNQPAKVDAQFLYNPFLDTLVVPNLSVSNSFLGTIANATTAANIAVTDNSTTNTNYLPTFVTAAGSSMPTSVDTGFTYNPFTNTLTAGNITATGTLSGTFGGTIANATNTVNTGITAVTTGTTYYPTFVSATSGNSPQLVDTDLQFNSTTNTLTCPTASHQTVDSTSTTGTLAIGGNLISTGNLTLGSSTANLNVANFITPTYTMPADSTAMNTIVATTAATPQTFNLTRIGQSYFVYRSVDTGIIPYPAGMVVQTGTVTNTGIYTVSFMARFSGPVSTGRGKMVSAWIYVSSPALYGGLGGWGAGSGQLGLNLVGYVSPYLDFNGVGVCFTGAWTGLINAGATLRYIAYNEYSGADCAIIGGNSSQNYLTITRIA